MQSAELLNMISVREIDSMIYDEARATNIQDDFSNRLTMAKYVNLVKMMDQINKLYKDYYPIIITYLNIDYMAYFYPSLSKFYNFLKIFAAFPPILEDKRQRNNHKNGIP